MADVILAARNQLTAQGASVIDVSIPDYNNVSNTSVITYEFKENLGAYLQATPAAPFKTLQDIYNSGLWHPSLQGVLTTSLALDTTMQVYHDRIAGREVFKQALLNALESNDLDGLIYPTIRQKPVLVPSTAQPGSNCRVSAQSGLPAISVPVGFTVDGIPVGMEFLGRDFSEGDLLSIAYSWEQATHVRRVPSATVPELVPAWPTVVSGSGATFGIDPSTQQFRFTAPGVDTFVYRDPDMKISPQWIQGQVRDDRWHIRYKVPVNAGKKQGASISVDDLWHEGATYDLQGTPVSQ